MRLGKLAMVLMCGAATLTGCDVEQPQKTPRYSTPRVENDVTGRSLSFETATPSPRATLVVSCKDGRMDSAMIRLSKEPDGPTPLRGVFGQFTVGRSPPDATELVALGSFWVPRDEEAANVRQILHRFGAGEPLSFKGDGKFMPDEEVTWAPPAPKTALCEPLTAAKPG